MAALHHNRSFVGLIPRNGIKVRASYPMGFNISSVAADAFDLNRGEGY
jgi:hypothetical protein